MPRRRVPTRHESQAKARRSRQRRDPTFVSKDNRGGCRTGKRRYRNEAEAKAALMSARSRGRMDDPKAERRREDRYYPCPICGGFHLTSAPELPRPM